MEKYGVEKGARIYADHMPLLIEEVRLGGYSGIRKCKKGKVEHGVKKVEDKHIVIVGGEYDPLFAAHKTWHRSDGVIKEHEPDCLASLRYAIISHKPNKYPNGLPKKSKTKTRSFVGSGSKGFSGGNKNNGFV